ncbi:hypothetical protein CDD82_6121 [Ophiocordyceps australis]|uniref:Uncharacterized protein n=1 Tax=Ophiocordyceps australis TaxID=1399860 RepID=A0A2C5YX68_9HYPO|nr:hypothetical protein CDD82_6121 [Ophiocordyceps australis]
MVCVLISSFRLGNQSANKEIKAALPVHSSFMLASDIRGHQDSIGASLTTPTAATTSSGDQESNMDIDSVLDAGTCDDDKQIDSGTSSMQTEVSYCTSARDSQMQGEAVAFKGDKADTDIKTLCSIAGNLSLSDAPRATEARTARFRWRKSNMVLLRTHLSLSSRAQSARLTPSWRVSKTRQTISRSSCTPELKMRPCDWPRCELPAPCGTLRESRPAHCNLSRHRQRRTEQWLMTLHADTGPDSEKQVAGSSQCGIAPVVSPVGKSLERRKTHSADCHIYKTQFGLRGDPDMKSMWDV